MENINTLILFIVASLAGLGLILLGTRLLSDGLQVIMGQHIRATMNRLGENSWNSISVGGLTSTMIQSRISAAVMAVSYAGSGLMNLQQLTLFLTGTALGTMVSPWIFVVEAGRLDLFFLALGILPMLYARWDRLAGMGRIVFALGLMLLGFDVIAFGSGDPDALLMMFRGLLPLHAVPELSDITLILLFALVLSYLFRSSVALLGFTMALVYSGLLSVPVAVILTIGFNLGATIIPVLTSRRSNLVARRGVLIYFFNHFVVVVLLISGYKFYLPTLTTVANTIGAMTTAQSLMFASVICIPITHVLFNFLAVLVSLLLMPFTLKLIVQLIPQPAKKQPQHLRFLGRPSHLAPSLAIEQANQEVKKLSAMIHSMLGMTADLFQNKQSLADQRIKKYESITDNILSELTVFIAKVMQASLSKRQSFEASCLLQVAIELEKIADCCEDIIDFQTSETVSDEILLELKSFFNTSLEAYEHIFPFITDQVHTSEKALQAFVDDMDKIIHGSVKVYDSLLEQGLRQKEEYETAVGVINSIRRIVEGSKSIIDIKKRYLLPSANLERA